MSKKNKNNQNNQNYTKLLIDEENHQSLNYKVIDNFNKSPHYYKKKFENILNSYRKLTISKLPISKLIEIHNKFQDFIIDYQMYINLQFTLNHDFDKLYNGLTIANKYSQLSSFFLTAYIAKEYADMKLNEQEIVVLTEHLDKKHVFSKNQQNNQRKKNAVNVIKEWKLNKSKKMNIKTYLAKVRGTHDINRFYNENGLKNEYKNISRYILKIMEKENIMIKNI